VPEKLKSITDRVPGIDLCNASTSGPYVRLSTGGQPQRELQRRDAMSGPQLRARNVSSH
jgi:hypothetical protein